LLGLPTQPSRLKPREHGIAELTVSVYETYAQPLTHDQLFAWHRMLTQGRRDLHDIGTYRTHPEPMQILSGPMERPLIHFEAPPSIQVPQEMAAFLTWFNRTQTQGPDHLPALTRAGLAHLYFESIHPFEDGNGRIGRAIVEKVLSQAQGAPSLIMVADQIQRRQKAYYRALERASQSNDVNDWLRWFAQVILDAQAHTQAALDLLLHQAKLLNRWGDQLHPRQVKVLKRLFRADPQGFEGGLSAKNYQRITQASPATVTRDLSDLVDKKILRREGARKGTRYYLVM
ncbi:MAG: Fic family protein, partial [Bacteroidota bacterium]